MRKGLCLGGGGVTGVAWEIGVLHGLQKAGIDLTDADHFVGTSAGSVVAVLATGVRPIAESFEIQTQPAPAEIGVTLASRNAGLMLPAMIVPGTEQQRRARIGRLARMSRGKHTAEERIEIIRSRIGSPPWPEQDVQITAVDAHNGKFTVFDRDSDVDLVHAVAASCAVPTVWPPVEIHGRLYMDGGVRSAVNADLAVGSDVIVVLAPMSLALNRSSSLSAQLRATKAKTTLVIEPDSEARRAFGPNPLDPKRRAEAARAGMRQAADYAAQVAEIWR